jgi:hypothetical protein
MDDLAKVLSYYLLPDDLELLASSSQPLKNIVTPIIKSKFYWQKLINQTSSYKCNCYTINCELLYRVSDAAKNVKSSKINAVHQAINYYVPYYSDDDIIDVLECIKDNEPYYPYHVDVDNIILSTRLIEWFIKNYGSVYNPEFIAKAWSSNSEISDILVLYIKPDEMINIFLRKYCSYGNKTKWNWNTIDNFLANYPPIDQNLEKQLLIIQNQEYCT